MMMMKIVYIVMIKDRIMLPSVFNDLFEEGEGRKALIHHFLLWIFQLIGFLQMNTPVNGLYFQYHLGNCGHNLVWISFFPVSIQFDI